MIYESYQNLNTIIVVVMYENFFIQDAWSIQSLIQFGQDPAQVSEYYIKSQGWQQFLTLLMKIVNCMHV